MPLNWNVFYFLGGYTGEAAEGIGERRSAA
jgi:hypothetical protein